MRITLGVQSSNVLRYLTQASDRIVETQSHAVTGKRIVKASDDVPGTSRAMTLRSTLAGIEQFQENSKMATSFLNSTDGALAGVNEALSDLRKIAVAVSSTMSDEVRNGYITGLDGIVQRLMDLGNTQQADRFLFAGMSTDTKPFVPGTAPAPVDYMGDSNYNAIWIQTSTSVEVNVPGDSVFNFGGSKIPGSPDTFTLIEQLRTSITTGDTTAASNLIADIDKHISNVLALRGEVGARGQRVEINADLLLASHERMSDMLSQTEDVDMAQAVVDLKTQENVYNAALAVTSRIMELSLANYLK